MKIRLILTNEDQGKVLSNPLYVSELEKHNIFVSDVSYDAIIIHASKLDDQILSQKHNPIIILERIDSAVVLKKKELKLDIVKGVIKNTIFNPIELSNSDCIHGRYHCKLMYDLLKNTKDEILINDDKFIYTELNISDISLDPTVFIAESELNKIYNGFSFCHYDKIRRLSDVDLDFDKSRANDLHFIGTLDYGKNILMTYHRHKALKEAQKLNIKSILSGGRTQNSSQYISSLLDTKIVLSPWGHGETCYRDYEALLCGCILLKPDSSFIKSEPDIFQNYKTYIPCRADFLDLEEKVHWILDNWNSLKDMRVENLKLVRDSMQAKNFAEHMSDIINRCLGC